MTLSCFIYHHLNVDDAKLFSNNIDNLQSALNRLSAWLCSRQLNLAPAKCEHLHISRSDNSLNHGFQVCSHSIKTVKDLGVLISYNLKWSQHIHHIRSTASVCAYQILRAFSSKNVWTLRKAFITYVCPNWNIIPQFGIHILKKTHSFWNLFKKSLPVMYFYAAIFHFARVLID